MDPRTIENPIPKDRMRIVLQLGKKDEFLAIDSDQPVHDLTKATRWNGFEWINYIEIGSWLKFTTNLFWVQVDKTLEEVGLVYPEQLTIM